MKAQFWLCKRGQVFYEYDAQTGQRRSLNTRSRSEAEKLLRARNESAGKPALGFALARAYLAAYDPTLANRTWEEVYRHYARQGQPQTQALRQRRFKNPIFDRIRNKKLLETTSDDFLQILNASGIYIHGVMRSLQNLAVGLGWLPWPVLPSKLWPRLQPHPKRGITREEHERILQGEQNPERKLFYDLLWETGASQSDAATLKVENVDWETRTLAYRRQKTGTWARLAIGRRLEAILHQLPQSGWLFPKQASLTVNARSAEFCRRCKLLGIRGISLHSYRYAVAERARALGYPERFAQEWLGHASKAVHRTYSRGAVVRIPALEDYEPPR